MTDILRRLVSGSKRRYTEDGFDLDLAYIDVDANFSRRLLAMAYPSDGLEALYRNNYREVKRFLQHQANLKNGDYKVYNLSAEKQQYTTDRLGGVLSTDFRFSDHEVPTLDMMWSFCKDLDCFLSQDPHNFAAVHCKAGKGRTGVMMCAYLLYKKLVNNAEQAMEIYGQQRSTISAGLTVPSQRRYVRYFEASLNDGQIPNPQPLTLETITLSGLKTNALKNMIISIHIRFPGSEKIQQLAVISGSKSDVPTKASLKADFSGVIFTPLPSGSSSSGLIDELKVDGDVRVEVYRGRVSSRRLVCRAWLNTAYLSPGSCEFSSHELDKGYGAVPEGLHLGLDFGPAERRQLSCNLSSTVSELESLPIGSPRTGFSPHSPLGTVLRSLRTSQDVASSSTSQPSLVPTPHILDVHPDFSIPARYFPQNDLFVTESDGICATRQTPFLAVVQECSHTPQESELSFALDEQELSARLESLIDSQSKVSEINPFQAASHSQQNNASGSQRISLDSLSGFQGGSRITRALSSKLRRVHWRSGREDPEIHEPSAPTTPSRPRHPSSFDWQHTPSLSLNPSTLDLNNLRLYKATIANSSSANLLSNDGLDTPSHGSQMIKWMTSSWWLSMA